LEGKLDASSFVRVYCSAIVNINCVRELHHEGRSDGWAILNNGIRIRMTSAGWQKLVLLSQL
jgi:DNA-binding LytR/AlgR family response regulator